MQPSGATHCSTLTLTNHDKGINTNGEWVQGLSVHPEEVEFKGCLDVSRASPRGEGGAL